MPMTKREFNRRLKAMDKVVQIKQDLKSLLPEIEQDKYLHMLSHLCYFHPNKKEYYARNWRRKVRQVKKLTPAEIVFLDYLLKNNLNPSTTYRWFLVSKLPEDIRTELRKGKLNVAQARKVATNRLRNRQSNTGIELLEEIKNIVECL